MRLPLPATTSTLNTAAPPPPVDIPAPRGCGPRARPASTVGDPGPPRDRNENLVPFGRAALPQAPVAVDKWHLVALANQVVTEVRQRATGELLGRRGTTAEKVWVDRRLLLTGYEHLSTKQRDRLMATLAAEDPTGEIGAAWGVKERLRMLLAETHEHRIRQRLYLFYRDAARAHLPEGTAEGGVRGRPLAVTSRHGGGGPVSRAPGGRPSLPQRCT